MFFRNRKSSGGSSENTSPIDEGQLFDDSNYGLPPGAVGDYLNADPTNPAYPVGSVNQGIPGAITNVQWSRLAFDYLVGLGNDPALTQRALAKYIAGMNLTAEEQSIVNTALTVKGAPPEGLILSDPAAVPAPNPPAPVPVPVPTPAPTPAPVPTARRGVNVARYTTYNTPWNSTLWGIANHYGVSLDQVERINGFAPYGSRNPSLVFTGEWIWVDP